MLGKQPKRFLGIFRLARRYFPRGFVDGLVDITPRAKLLRRGDDWILCGEFRVHGIGHV